MKKFSTKREGLEEVQHDEGGSQRSSARRGRVLKKFSKMREGLEEVQHKEAVVVTLVVYLADVATDVLALEVPQHLLEGLMYLSAFFMVLSLPLLLKFLFLKSLSICSKALT